MAALSIVERDRQWFRARHGALPAETRRGVAFCAHAICTPGRQLVVEDARLDPRFRDNPVVVGLPGIRAYAGTPLAAPSGNAVGTLCVIDTSPRRFSGEQLDGLRELAGWAGAILGLHRAGASIDKDVLSDRLTGVGTRPALLRALDRALAAQRRGGASPSILLTDLDGLRSINMAGGYTAGDAALRAVAAALKDATGPDATVARLGGSGFALVVHGASPDAGRRLAKLLRERVVDRLRLAGQKHTSHRGGDLFSCSAAVRGNCARVRSRRAGGRQTDWRSSCGRGRRGRP
jgi:diguanylate cyclase (GGDEF)-like protein